MTESTRRPPDDFPLTALRLPTRIRNVLAIQGFKTVGDVRSASNKTLLSLPDFGPRSVAQLRLQRVNVDARMHHQNACLPTPSYAPDLRSRSRGPSDGP